MRIGKVHKKRWGIEGRYPNRRQVTDFGTILIYDNPDLQTTLGFAARTVDANVAVMRGPDWREVWLVQISGTAQKILEVLVMVGRESMTVQRRCPHCEKPARFCLILNSLIVGGRKTKGATWYCQKNIVLDALRQYKDTLTLPFISDQPVEAKTA